MRHNPHDSSCSQQLNPELCILLLHEFQCPASKMLCCFSGKKVENTSFGPMPEVERHR
jgi:hypothetical protein